MPKTSYKVALSDGTFATRKSDRVYTHIVVGRHSYENALAVASKPSKETIAVNRSNFAYYTKIATGSDPYPSKTYRVEGAQHWNAPNGVWSAEEVAEEKARVDAENVKRREDAERRINGHTVETYLEALRLANIAAVEANKAKGYYDTLVVLGWCGRLDLAHKQVTSHSKGHYIDLAIVEVA